MGENGARPWQLTRGPRLPPCENDDEERDHQHDEEKLGEEDASSDSDQDEYEHQQPDHFSTSQD